MIIFDTNVGFPAFSENRHDFGTVYVDLGKIYCFLQAPAQKNAYSQGRRNTCSIFFYSFVLIF
jgi:hypothetical protein